MFHRALQVKWVKTKKEEAQKPSQVDHTLEGKSAIVGYTIDKVVDKIGRIVLTYVIIDRIKQVLVANASKQ